MLNLGERFWVEASCAIMFNIGALIIRIGFRGPLYYNSKRNPKIVEVIGPYSKGSEFVVFGV